MLNNVYQDERYIRSLDLEHRPRLIEVMARLPILFERVYQQVVPPTQWIRPEWETLEVIVFQATADRSRVVCSA